MVILPPGNKIHLLFSEDGSILIDAVVGILVVTILGLGVLGLMSEVIETLQRLNKEFLDTTAMASTVQLNLWK